MRMSASAENLDLAVHRFEAGDVVDRGEDAEAPKHRDRAGSRDRPPVPILTWLSKKPCPKACRTRDQSAETWPDPACCGRRGAAGRSIPRWSRGTVAPAVPR